MNSTLSSFRRARAESIGVALLLALGACGDDGPGSSATDSTGTTGADTSTGPTTATDTTGPDPSTSSGVADTASTSSGSDGTTEAGDAGETSTGADSSSSSDGTTTGVAPFDVPFMVLDPRAVPLPSRVTPGWVVITTEAEWDAWTGAPLPAGVSLPEQWLVYGTRGPQPFPGHAVEVSALTWDDGALVVDGSGIEPGPDCETYQFTWPADTLLAIDALEVDVSTVDDQTLPAPFDCALGAGESMGCDLDTPCATGLLCAGLIRSTVLLGSPGGLCLPADYAGVFAGGMLAIPADGSTAETSMVVAGLTTVDMDVVVWVELDHPAPEELVIELRNPDTNQVLVASLPPGPLHPGGVGIVPTGFSGDESVNGTWWLVVTDTVPNGNSGSVLSWELEIMSRFD